MIKLNKLIFRKFSTNQKDSDFYDFVIKNLNKNSSTYQENEKNRKKTNFKNDDKKSNENSSFFNDNSKIFKERNYFKLKHNILTPRIQNDMNLLKLKEGFSSNELRQKYLSLAKMYHPDVVSNDKHVKII